MNYKSWGKSSLVYLKVFLFRNYVFTENFGVKDHLHVYEVHKTEFLHNLLHNCVLFLRVGFLTKLYLCS